MKILSRETKEMRGRHMKRIAIVTGASSGIGREFVVQLAQKNKVDEIWAIARRVDRLYEMHRTISQKVRPVPLDLVGRTD